MKQLLFTVISAAALWSCTNNTTIQNKQQSIKSMEKLEKEKIKKLLSVYESALNASDAKLAKALYAKHGVFMPSEGPSAIGSENILASYNFVFSQIQLNIKFFIEEIEVDENMAFAVTASKGTTLIHSNGVTVPEANRELFVFEKEDEEWKIARYMFNKTEPKK